MKHERASTSRSTMQTHRLAIELNSSADLSKSTPDGDEDLFLRHGPSSRRPIRVTVECRLAAATISMDGRQGLPHSCPPIERRVPAIPASSEEKSSLHRRVQTPHATFFKSSCRRLIAAARRVKLRFNASD